MPPERGSPGSARAAQRRLGALPLPADARRRTGEGARGAVSRLGDRVDAEDVETGRVPLCAWTDGFSLHAGVVVPARDRKRLEHLSRTIARPPIADERLSILPDGRVAYAMKRRFADGTTHVLLRPEKLCALVPAPRANPIRYHGVLAAHARLRADVVADRRAPPPVESAAPASVPPAAVRARHLSWAELLQRVFEFDVLVCPRCAGRMKVLAAVNERKVIVPFLACLGLSSEVPVCAPARPPPGAGDAPFADDLDAPFA